LREQPTFKVSGPNKYKMPDSGYRLQRFEIHVQPVAIAYCGEYKPVRRRKSMRRTLYKQEVTLYRMFIVTSALLAGLVPLIIIGMKSSPWQRRIQRAGYLAKKYSFSSEILGFYVDVARFQEELYGRLEVESENLIGAAHSPPERKTLIASFGPFLAVIEKHGPQPLVAIARELRASSSKSWSELLDESWSPSESADGPEKFLARALLQPYAELLRSRSEMKSDGHTHGTCPFCGRKAGLGVLRPQGDGASRFLMCSFCLAEWEFRRILCPSCGEQDNNKLPVYTATDFDYIRVECCDTCKTYIKSVDLSKNGLAEPMVDEIAAAPLDLWAQQHGYSKLQLNLMGM
jgi:formate dehydrogenase maturation protein FdhE